MSLLAVSLSKGILKFERGTNLGIAFERDTTKRESITLEGTLQSVMLYLKIK